jgi:hypothetical protein
MNTENLKPWPKGVSGNPNGRPKKNGCMTEILRKGLKAKGPDGRPNKEAIVDKIIALGREGEKWAAELVWERCEGKVPTPLQHSGPEGGAIPLTIASEDAARIAAAIERMAGRGDKA